MPLPVGNVDLGVVDLYRPVINRLHAESPWRYAFDHCEELKTVIETFQQGRLLRPEDTYDFIQQLYPEQLNSLLGSIFSSIRPNLDVFAKAQYLIVSKTLEEQSSNCFLKFINITHRTVIDMGIAIPDQDLDQIIATVLPQVRPEFTVAVTNDLLVHIIPLFHTYEKLLAFISFLT
ncbi:hypothetical protein GOP47_0030872 [Adiantum capillus-veneris]|nr:hypothetical protein GOP47_0030872 [Adiantum capillus-veneris]